MKKLISKILFVNILLSVLFWSCHDTSDGHTHDENGDHVDVPEDDHHGHEEEGGDEVELTKEQIQKIGLKYGTFENRNLQSTLKVNGLLELPPVSDPFDSSQPNNNESTINHGNTPINKRKNKQPKYRPTTCNDKSNISSIFLSRMAINVLSNFTVAPQILVHDEDSPIPQNRSSADNYW